MTIETAKKVLEEMEKVGKDNYQFRLNNFLRIKEAEAVCRGGFTFCEHEGNGGRKYIYLKVKPTKTDEESSLNAALEEYRNKKGRKPKQIVEEPLKQGNSSNYPENPTINKGNTMLPIPHPTFLERIKIKAEAIWKEIDSLVVE